MNCGPGFFPRTQRKSRITGHSAGFVQPTNGLMPFRNSLSFDCFIATHNKEGKHASSTAMSPTLRWTDGSYTFSVSTVSSPALEKAKRHRYDAAHRTFILWVVPVGSHSALIFVRWVGVIGTLERCPTFVSASCFFIPLVMYFKRL